MYTQKQKEIIAYTKKYVAQVFAVKPAPGHDFSHAKRVAAYAVLIARAEKVNVFLSELSGWLHDLGRSIEHEHPGVSHHNLSYKMCQKLFRADPVFSKLSRNEKIILLYAIKYHWNDAADQYREAIILRDADKIDALGTMGNARAHLIHRGHAPEIIHSLRLRFVFEPWIRTAVARSFIVKHKLLKPMFALYKKLLKKQITPVSF